MAGFGGSVKLTGEAQYRQALQAIAADLKNVAAQQKLTAATYDKSDSSLTALSKRSEELKNKLASQQEKVKTLTAALKDYQNQQEKNKSTLQNLQSQLDKEKAKLVEIEAQYGKNSKEYEQQVKVIDNLEKELKDLNTQYDKNETTIKKTQAALTSAEADVKKTGTQMEKLGKQAEEAGVGADKLGIAVDDSGKKARSAAEGGYTVFKNILANLATQVINRALDGVKSLSRAVFDAGMNFDSAMSKVQAISGASAEEMAKLTDKAKEMGETTKFSASESAEALNYMAMAGWKTEDMLNGLEGIMHLAAASGSDLATTSDIVTDALTAMGYSAGEAGRLADVMAAASSNANTNVEMMGMTFQYAAPIVGALGYSMEDTAVAIGLMANAGIKGEKAGTALRSVLTRLSAPPAECAKAMEKLGISITDSEGKMKPLNTVIDDLRKAFDGLSESEQTQLAKNIAGQEAMSGLLAIVNAAPADYEKLTKAVNNSSGAAEKMADTMQNNVGGKMTLLKSQLEGIYLTIWKKVEPTISKTIDSISKALKNVDWNKFGETASKALERVADAFKWLIEHKDVVINAIKMMIAAFAVNKIANFTNSLGSLISTFTNVASKAGSIVGKLTGISSAAGTLTTAASGAATSTGLLSSAMGLLTNPISLVAVGAAGLVTALVASTYAMNGVGEKTQLVNQHLAESKKILKENTSSWEELSKTQQDNVNKGMTEMSYYQSLADELADIVDANGKVKSGYEDRAAFITSTLRDALGIEIQMTDGVVQGYADIEKSIQSTIAAKKAKVQLDAQEALYTEALQKQGEVISMITQLEKDKAEAQAESTEKFNKYTEALLAGNEMEAQIHLQAWQRSEERKNKIEADLGKQEELYSMYAYNIGQYEDNMAKYSQGKYDEMSNIVWEYTQDYQSAEEAQKAALADQIANTETQISLLNKIYKEKGDERIKNQITTAEKTLSNLKSQMGQYNSTTETNLKANLQMWDSNLDSTLSQITGANVEFRDAGDGNVQMYINGIASGEAKSKSEMRTIVEETVGEISKQKPLADSAGQNLIAGVNNGIANQNQQSSAFRSISTFGSNLLSRLRASLQEHSPSKATNEMGRFLLQGLGLGIKTEEDVVISQVEDFGENVLGALNGALDEGVNTNALQALQTAIPTEFNASIGTNTAQMAEAAQTADKSLVGYFKQALSEMKIEMDDQEMGRFVDNTVTRLVYN